MAVPAVRPKHIKEIPVVTCPVCAGHMRLATVEPMVPNNDDHMSFECDCGFEYRLSAAAADEGKV